LKAHANLVEELRDWEKAKKRLGKEQYYTDWLQFFQHEIEQLGWEKTLAEYMFKGDERADDMLVRMFAGKLPISCLSVTGGVKDSRQGFCIHSSN
jgi:hypothetical protein